MLGLIESRSQLGILFSIVLKNRVLIKKKHIYLFYLRDKILGQDGMNIYYITLMVLVKFLCVRLALYFEIFSLRSSAL